MGIPLLDMQAQHAAVDAELRAAIDDVLAGGRFVGGPAIAEFEERFADYCRARHAVGASSGTTAITLGLMAAGVGPGDEVITTAMTFIATVEAIVEAGATPVLVDPDADSANLTVDAVEAAITDRTKAILVVHLYGQTVDLDGFRELADRRGLVLGEDAAQAHGAEWNGRRAGSVGDFGTFSFFPGKNLGAIGDAGALTTNYDAIAERARLLRDHGRRGKYTHEIMGTNARLDTLQAAVLSVKLAKLEEWTEGRRAHARAYDEAFADVDGVDPIAVSGAARHVYHQYVVRVEDRDGVLEGLRAAGIGAGVHYPIPLNRQPAMKDLVSEDGFPNADRLASTVLSLPVFPELTEEQRNQIVGTVADLVGARTPEAVVR